MSQLLALLRKDLLQEWRQKTAFYSVILYAGATVFSIYLMAGQPEGEIWNVLFWITQLFIAINGVAKSFLQEPPQRYRYYYTLVRPATFLGAKLIYSVMLMLIMSAISLGLFCLMLGTPIIQAGVFFLTSFTGALSLALLFTFLSAVSARAGQSATLMAILGFPLITPILMMLAKLSLRAVSPIYQEGWWALALVLIGIDLMIVVVGLILFPFLWQE